MAVSLKQKEVCDKKIKRWEVENEDILFPLKHNDSFVINSNRDTPKSIDSDTGSIFSVEDQIMAAMNPNSSLQTPVFRRSKCCHIPLPMEYVEVKPDELLSIDDLNNMWERSSLHLLQVNTTKNVMANKRVGMQAKKSALRKNYKLAPDYFCNLCTACFPTPLATIDANLASGSDEEDSEEVGYYDQTNNKADPSSIKNGLSVSPGSSITSERAFKKEHTQTGHTRIKSVRFDNLIRERYFDGRWIPNPDIEHLTWRCQHLAAPCVLIHTGLRDESFYPHQKMHQKNRSNNNFSFENEALSNLSTMSSTSNSHVVSQSSSRSRNTRPMIIQKRTYDNNDSSSYDDESDTLETVDM